jgi:TPP-dependent trihydroxycyclohexane-1,2-dione (THcHDO) dehydratase
MGTAFVSIVCTDERYGVIELNQQRRFGRTFAVEFSNPDLVKYAEAFGLPGFRVECAEDLSAVLRRALDLDVPSIVDLPVDRGENMRLGAGAYEQPVTRADIRNIRSVDSDAVVETLRARGLVAKDPRFGGRGRPGFLITTPAFLQYFGLTSLSSLPPRDRSPGS